MEEIDPNLTAQDMISLIYAEIERKGIAGHHIDSMNSFYSVGMEQIMKNIFKIDTRPFKNTRDNDDEDRTINEISATVSITRLELRKPTYILAKSGMERPLMPQTARELGLTYSLTILIDAEIVLTATLIDGTTKSRSDTIVGFRIGAIPCMLGSIYCHTYNQSRAALFAMGEDPNYPGGVFIVNGTTWAVTTLENITYNAFHIHHSTLNKEVIRGNYISKAGDTFENSFQYILRYMSNNLITFDILTVKNENLEIPFYLLFRALGMTADRDIINNIVYGIDDTSPITNEIMKTLQLAFEAPIGEYEPMRYVVDPDEIISFIGRKLIVVENEAAVRNNVDVQKYINGNFLSLVDRNIFPHIGTDPESRVKKLKFLASLINELISAKLKVIETTDRDSYKHKRLGAAGVCVAKSYKQLYNVSVVKEIIKALKKEFKSSSFSNINLAEVVKSAIKPDDLETLLSQSITAGNKTMVVKRNEVKNRISSQAISIPKNDLYTKSVLNIINAGNFNPSKQTDRADEMRRVHKTFIGYVDVSMSADTGEPVGLVKQMACMASISLATSSFNLKKILLVDPLILRDVQPEDINRHRLAKVYVNGDWIGCCRYAHEVALKYRMLRRTNGIHQRTSIVWEPLVRKVQFFVDVGRILRPLIIVYNNLAEYIENHQNGDKSVKFRQWIRLTKDHVRNLITGKINMAKLEEMQIIEYISAEEQENTFLAENLDILRQDQNSTHYKYTHCDIDQAIFGIITLASPLANHSNATRITYFTNHRKQSAGWFALNYPRSVQKNTIIQWYCERPLISTLGDALAYPNGQNSIFLVGAIDGVCLEDGLTYCQTAIDCGMNCGTYYTFEKSELENDESFENVDRFKTKDINSEANYEYIEKGVIRVGSPVTRNTVLISKVLKLNKPVGQFTHADRSVIYRGFEEMRVDKVIVGQNEKNIKFVKVIMRSVRNLMVGDKLSSRTGNKGIVSKKKLRIDMPYTADGMRCSGIVGPHSFPTRMAVNQTLEMGMAMIAAREGCFIDGTTFMFPNMDYIMDYFKNAGNEHKGSRFVINPRTNMMYDNPMFIAPVTYLRLQKYAIDSQYAMRDGPTTAAMHQPLEGRSKDGGLRIGEMESWVYTAQGAMRALDEKFYQDSDGYNLPVCRGCGQVASINKKLNIWKCNNCRDNASIGEVSSSWCTNLFNHEARAMNVNMSFWLDPYTFERWSDAK